MTFRNVSISNPPLSSRKSFPHFYFTPNYPEGPPSLILQHLTPLSHCSTANNEDQQKDKYKDKDTQTQTKGPPSSILQHLTPLSHCQQHLPEIDKSSDTFVIHLIFQTTVKVSPDVQLQTTVKSMKIFRILAFLEHIPKPTKSIARCTVRSFC